MDPTLALSCLLALGILTTFLGIGLIVGKPKVALEKRIDDYAALVSAEQFEEKKKSEDGRSKSGTRGGLAKYLRGELARADLAFTVTEYIFLNIMTTLLGLLLTYVIFRGNLLLTLLGALGGFYAPTAFLRYSQGRRRAAFSSQIENTIVLLANALRSGYGLMQAIESVGKQVPPPTSQELERVVRESALGVPMETALANLSRRNPSVDLEIVITAINVSRVTGGKLADVLDAIASTIRDRVRLAGEIHALTSQQRFSAIILTLLPGFLGLVLFALNPDYFAPLWRTTCGLALLGMGLVLIVIGNLIIRRIITLQY